jgi:hypothetical protein
MKFIVVTFALLVLVSMSGLVVVVLAHPEVLKPGCSMISVGKACVSSSMKASVSELEGKDGSPLISPQATRLQSSAASSEPPDW